MAEVEKSRGNGAGSDPKVIAQLRRFWVMEASGVEKYERLAKLERDGTRKMALLDISRGEKRHADHWARRLQELGQRPPRLSLGWHTSLTLLVGRVLGVRSAMFLLRAKEREEIHLYQDKIRQEFDPDSQQIINRIMPEELRHLESISRLSGEGGAKASAGIGTLNLVMERWHTSGAAVRNLVFGANDGLVSTLSLVSGISGASSSSNVVVVAGLTGLIAGTISMAAGAFISVRSQREVYDQEIKKEAEEIDQHPEEERDELRAIYRSKGFTREEVEILVHRVTEDRERWLKTLAREELGLGEEKFESPYTAGGLAGFSFAFGAVVPILPYVFLGGLQGTLASIIASIAAAFGIGALKSLVTGRRWLRSGVEMVIIGGVAATVTYFIGGLFEI